MTTLRNLLNNYIKILDESGDNTAVLDAEIIFCYVLGQEKSFILSH